MVAETWALKSRRSSVRMMEFDTLTTAVVFVALIVVGVGGASMSPMTL